MANLIFERGDPHRPVGHAFLYFRSGEAGKVLATYLVVPPIEMDLAKYVPPLLAASIGTGTLAAHTSVFPVPPAPEPVDLAEVRDLAERRGDDVLVLPTPASTDVALLMGAIMEVGEAYSQTYQQGLASAPVPATEPEAPGEESPQVRALLYAALSERERLESLARELGSLRYGIEGGDRPLVETTLREMQAIAASLAVKYRAGELVEAAARLDGASVRLVELYLERAYKLCSDDYEGLTDLEAEIALLHGSAHDR